jgi:hypothetical protein
MFEEFSVGLEASEALTSFEGVYDYIFDIFRS